MKSLNSFRSFAGFATLLTFLTLASNISKAQPDHLWSRSFGGTHTDRINDLAYDQNGNLYATGAVQGLTVLSDHGDTLHQGSVGNHEIILNKYSPDGEMLWSRVWAGTGSDEGRALSTDEDGNVYLTGTFTGLINFGTTESPIWLESLGWGSDAFLLKVNPEGVVQWVKGLGGEFTSMGSGVAATPDGHVVMCGRFLDSLIITPPPPNYTPQAGTDGNRVFLIKFSQEGDYMWLKRFGGSAGQAPKSLKADASGNLILAGDFIGTLLLHPGDANATFTSQGSDLYLAKYDSLGNYLWARSIGAAGWEFAQGLDVAPGGDIALSGSFTATFDFGETPGQHVLNNVLNADVFVARLSANGNTLWAHSAGSTGSDVGLAVAIDDFNQVHISGEFRQEMSFSNADETFNIQASGVFQNDAFMASYSPDGNLHWAANLGCPYSAHAQTLATHDEKLAMGGRFSGSLHTDFESQSPTIASQFNGSSMDAFVTSYQIKDESVAVCTAQGGTLEAPANRSFCIGTGQPTGISVTAVGASGSLQRWALINGNGDIVASRASNSHFNLDVFPPGNYSIRYLRYEADVSNLAAIDHISKIGLLNGCHSLADNAINIFLRSEPEGGVLSANGPTQLCAGQAAQPTISLSVSGHSGQFNRFALVSLPTQTLVASNTTGNFDLSNLPVGNYAASHLSYEQGVNLNGVTSASQLQGCYALSNSITISLTNCNATVQAHPNPTSSVSQISFSTPLGGYGILEVYDMSGRRVTQLWEGEMQSGEMYLREFQADGLPNGVYLIRLTLPDKMIVQKLLIGG